MYTIGQVSEMFDIPVSTLRYYDKEGLFPDMERRSGIRRFGEKQIEALRVIECLKASGLESLRDILHNKTTLMAGNSGVGKSTLLNALIPGVNVRTEEISESHQTGMHTTTFSEMFALPDGGGLIDIPGVKGFGTFDIEPEEVSHYFRDIFRIAAGCRFNNCTHTHEPGCAVLEALENGSLPLSRYQSYLSMMEDKDEGKYRAAF